LNVLFTRKALGYVYFYLAWISIRNIQNPHLPALKKKKTTELNPSIHSLFLVSMCPSKTECTQSTLRNG
jgi:hypothetical protein